MRRKRQQRRRYAIGFTALERPSQLSAPQVPWVCNQLLQAAGHVHQASPGMQSGVQGQSFEASSFEQSELSSWIRAYVPAQVANKKPIRNTFFIE